MRHASVFLEASVAAMVAMILGGCAVTPASPAPRQTAPATAAGTTATPTTAVAASPSVATAASPAPAASVPAGARIDGRIQVGEPVTPRWFAADDQSLWVHEPESLVRVDLATSAVKGQVNTGWMEYGYAGAGAGSVWQSDYEGNHVLRIDPDSGKLLAKIPVGLQPLGVVVTADAVWVANEHSGSVTRIDPATNKVVATIPVGPVAPNGPQIMTAGPGGVWVGIQHTGENVRVDAATNTVGLRVPLDGPVASDGKQVWIGVDAGGTTLVVRIDPVSGKVITTVDLETQGICGLAVGLGSVWVADGGLTRIDPATGRIVGHLPDIGGCGNVVVAGGAVWVAAEGQPYVLRISPQ